MVLAFAFRSLDLEYHRRVLSVAKKSEAEMMANKSLQATRDGRSSSASRFTLVGPACLSSGR